MADKPVGVESGGTLGIIAGSGRLPRRLIDDCRHRGRDVFVLALEGEADAETVGAAAHAWCRLGAAAKALKLLRAHGVTDVVYAGGVRRPTLAAIRPDWRAARFFAKVGYRLLGAGGQAESGRGEESNQAAAVHQILLRAGLPSRRFTASSTPPTASTPMPTQAPVRTYARLEYRR